MGHDDNRRMKSAFLGGNRWLIAIIAFLTVVFMVNSALLYVAVATDDGLVDEDYYRKGLLYDKGLAGEKALGWDIGLSFKAGAPHQGPAKIRVDITRLGYAVTDASVAVVLKRPASGRFDTPLKLSASGQGYAGEVDLPLDGLWDIEVTAGRNGQTMVRTFRVKA